ncbi:hypothetical protein [Macrococcoides caseolyticum]|uniref:Uncharacterized protein n=1 Tax=Macrococcoides caseolyticum TaxID=69966 RepID=A0ACC9MQL8_9STAP|nr:hypothetical protein [Macrococcus caseolyticus]PKE39006.1 hypothetical protein CW675_08725 [Macrococcus caseolyticus]PKE51593.1 hypothetical protein CW672_00390 [Macrococcus caseolyticus]PKE56072.1 hypothetical protein CW682_09005 [Macrococcus caseolyticus]PKE73066.1 hypothetical protein CW665_01145 [Macrococcus caseolyticus]PKF41549.1 hypothetical protein CW661_03985 [Macrococcus caseolyticus]
MENDFWDNVKEFWYLLIGPLLSLILLFVVRNKSQDFIAKHGDAINFTYIFDDNYMSGFKDILFFIFITLIIIILSIIFNFFVIKNNSFNIFSFITLIVLIFLLVWLFFISSLPYLGFLALFGVVGFVIVVLINDSK